MVGASINPTPRPNRTFATYISQMLSALEIINQAMPRGIFTTIIDGFLPNGSVLKVEICDIPSKLLATGYDTCHFFIEVL